MGKLKKMAVKFTIGAAVLIASVVFTPSRSHARTYDETYETADPNTRTDVTINVASPELFSDHLEFYCGKETFYIYINAGETMTSVTYSVPKGVNKVDFFDPDDIAGSFDITYDEWLDTDKQSSIDVIVNYSEKVDAQMEITGDEYIKESVPSLLEYDFSDGREYGLLSISCTQHASIDSVVYRLMGDRVYEITLDSEHGYAAAVRLPAGITYRELGSINVVPNKLADVPDGVSFSWGHRDDPGYFGNNYEVTAGSCVQIDDLYIKMNYNGALTEVDDVLLLSPKINEQYELAADERRSTFLESHYALAGLDEDVSRESSAPVVAQEQERPGILAIIGAALVIMIVVGAAAAHIRRSHRDL